MNKRVYPIGYRLGYTRGYDSKWVSLKSFGVRFLLDQKVRTFLQKRLEGLGLDFLNLKISFRKDRVIIFFNVITLRWKTAYTGNEFKLRQKRPPKKTKKKHLPKDFTYKPKKKKKIKRIRRVRRVKKVKDLTPEEKILVARRKRRIFRQLQKIDTGYRKLDILYYKYLSRVLSNELNSIFKPWKFTLKIHAVDLTSERNRIIMPAPLGEIEGRYFRYIEDKPVSDRGFMRLYHSKSLITGVVLNEPSYVSRVLSEALVWDSNQSHIIKSIVIALRYYMCISPYLRSILIKMKGRLGRATKTRPFVLALGERFSEGELDYFVKRSDRVVAVENGSFGVSVSFFYGEPLEIKDESESESI